MPVYQIGSDVDIASIVSCFLTKKQITVKYFSKIFDVYKPILLTKSTGKSTQTLVVQI